MTQVALWFLLIGPWFGLLFLDSKRIRHFISVAFFTIILTSIFWQVAQVFDWWRIDENLPFLTNTSAFNYGLLPVITVFVFYFTFPNTLLFFGVNIVIDAIQAFIISPYIFERLKFYHMAAMSNLGLFVLLLSFVPFIYIYQIWYDKRSEMAGDVFAT